MLPPPPPGPARRRLVALCVVALLALMVGIIVGAGGDSPSKKTGVAATKPPAAAVAKAKGLPLRRQIGQVLMIAFQGTTPPAYIKSALRQGRAAGVILFHGNAPSPDATKALTRALQRSSRNRALIATDQEGGSIRILPWLPPTTSQGATPTPQAARSQARAAATG